MNNFHSLLKRQMRRLLGENSPPEDWSELLPQIDDAYRQFDRDRTMIERSMEISSHELQQANADIRAVLEGLVDYYLRLDESGIILYGRGLSAPAILINNVPLAGKNIRDIIIPKHRPLLDNQLTNLKTENELQITECDAEMGSELLHYEIRCVPAHNHQVSVIIRNITTSKNAALREQQLQQRLSRAERIESLGILAGGVAHDLNNILSPLVTYPDLLIESFKPDDPQHSMLKQMQKSVFSATAIIQDLLTLTRRGNNQSDPVDVNRVLNQYLQSADFIELSKTHPTVSIETHVEKMLPHLRGSPHQLTQTVMNLITNAYESIGQENEGKISISASLEKSLLENDAPQEDNSDSHVLLKIQDSGCGIPPDEIDNIFEPFFSRRKNERGGTGLGLSIVYGAVKDFGGTIDVQSSIGKGTCFSIRLPVNQQSARAKPKQMELGNPAATPCSILVVDDDENQRELCRAILSTKKYSVSTAINGREAIAWLKLNDVDMVLLDMIMEDDCDGLRTYEAIRTFKPEQKCIIVSGYAKTENVQKAISLGVHSLVQKPYTLNTLQTSIQAALDDTTNSAAK